ncbi:MAG: ABC-type multidrug transport system fused ATPase/permease subunit [Bacillariaceae sp.]|jgi:ABC-type multidrug transport system fused ATPase/permease subunit
MFFPHYRNICRRQQCSTISIVPRRWYNNLSSSSSSSSSTSATIKESIDSPNLRMQHYLFKKRRTRFTKRTTSLSFSSTTISSNEKNNDDKKIKEYDISSSSSSSSSSDTINTISTSSTSTSDSLYRLLQMNRSEWTTIGLAASTLVVTSSVTLLLPFASGSVIDYTIANGENGGTSPLFLAGGLFALSSLAGGGVYLRTLWLAKAGNRIVARIKQRLYSSILRKDSSFLDRQTTGDLLSRLTSDAQLLQGALTTQAVAGMRATVMSTGAMGMLLYTSPTLALVSCATLPPIFILTRHFSKQLKTRQERVQKLLGEATSLAEQALSHPTTVKQSVAETYETVRYRNGVAAAHAESVDTAHMQAQLEAGSHISANAAILGVLGIGGSMVLDGSITAGDLTGFVMYSLLMAGNLSSLTSIYGEVARASAASSRIFELMDQPTTVVSSKGIDEEHTLLYVQDDPLVQIEYNSKKNQGHNNYDTTVSSTDPNTNNPSQRAASIEIENLSFQYPSRPDVPVINNLNLTIPAGGVLALVGASGSGKVSQQSEFYKLRTYLTCKT